MKLNAQNAYRDEKQDGNHPHAMEMQSFLPAKVFSVPLYESVIPATARFSRPICT